MTVASLSAIPPGASVARTLTLLKNLPGTGPRPQTVTPPEACAVAHTKEESLALLPPPHDSFVHRGGATIPPGVYVTTDTTADFHAHGQYGRDTDKDVVYTSTFRADGSFLETQRPDYPDQGPVRGRYQVVGDTVTFTFEPQARLTPETVRWSYYQGQLTFQIVSVQDPGGLVYYTAHPWRRVS
jgi:hypothetical protein